MFYGHSAFVITQAHAGTAQAGAEVAGARGKAGRCASCNLNKMFHLTPGSGLESAPFCPQTFFLPASGRGCLWRVQPEHWQWVQENSLIQRAIYSFIHLC